MTDWSNHFAGDKTPDFALSTAKKHWQNSRKTEANQTKPHPNPVVQNCNPQLTSHLARLTCRKLAELIDSSFDKIDDYLFDKANMARSNTEQSKLFDSMRELRLKRKNYEQFLTSSVTKLFSNPFLDVQSKQSQNSTAETLSLVQDEQLETQVLIESNINSLRVTYLGEILQFQTRYSTLFENSTSSKPANPLDPEKVTNLVAKGCTYFDLEQDDRLMVLKQINKTLGEAYGSLLDILNTELIAQGILPTLKFKSSTNNTEIEEESSHSIPAGPESDKEKPVTAVGPDSEEQDILVEMKSLLAKLRSRINANSASYQNQAKPAYKQEELFDALSSLQDSYTKAELYSGKAEVLDIKEAISRADSYSGAAAKSIAEHDEDLINLVAMLFEFILDDYNLSAPIQVLISRLQIPIVKVVLRDQTFFSKAKHPARKLLNALAKAGIGWNDDSEKKKDQLYTQIQKIVLRILDEFDGNITLFQELYDKFQHFTEREYKRSAIIEARTKEAEIGRIKSQRAQAAVKRVLRALLRDTNLPPIASEILQSGWSRVMFIAYLKDESENRWQESTQIAETLIWCLEPHTDAKEREKWCRTVPVLLKKLKTGLTEISYNSANLNQKIEELKSALTSTFKDPAPIRKDSVIPNSGLKVTKQKATDKAPSTTKTLSPEDKQVLKLSEGDWIEFSLINGSKFRCKLSTIVKDADCYIFVNRMGLKVLEKTREELATDLREEKVAILQQGLMIDRALNAVVGNLRKMSDQRA
ncbi:MAG: hypothetical protein CSA50_03415 [Gammaproteobacteria bacterium]|nr:MAG: hypothetical protein CSA50_03415 [Gammaproteobacteria bacterium]